jgi:hypothetical protein
VIRRPASSRKQPIDAAPRDGSWIIVLAGPKQEPVEAHWSSTFRAGPAASRSFSTSSLTGCRVRKHTPRASLTLVLGQGSGHGSTAPAPASRLARISWLPFVPCSGPDAARAARARAGSEGGA